MNRPIRSLHEPKAGQKSSVRRPKPISLKWFGWTDKGKVRANNEDSFLGLRFNARDLQRLGKFGEASLESMDFTFAVSDGMGGARAGEFASQIAVDKITTLLPRAFQQSASGLQAGFADILGELYTRIHHALVHLGQSYEECNGMETTMSLCWFTPGKLFFGHVGDSRIYFLPKGKKEIQQITHDDTHVGWLLRSGQINEREARSHPRRNVLQKALGGGNQFVDPQIGALDFNRGDIFLICSDGLIDGLYDHHLVELLRQPPVGQDYNPARLLVDTAVHNSGRDNATAVVIQIA